jgi:hypothetical protein
VGLLIGIIENSSEGAIRKPEKAFFGVVYQNSTHLVARQAEKALQNNVAGQRKIYQVSFLIFVKE